MAKMRGIDVSKHQGSIDWSAVKAAGYSFAMLRACLGWDNENQIDSFLRSNVQGCEAAVIPYGLYHYSYAGSSDDALREADFFLRVVEGFHPEMPVAFDFEEPFQLALPPDQQLDIIDSFMQAVEQAGYYAVLYMSAYALQRLIEHAPDRIGRYDLWAAQWGTDNCGIPQAGLWQYHVVGRHGTLGRDYTLFGEVQGVSANCDVNYAYKDYPSIIRRAGLNRFEAGQAPPEMVPRAEYQALQARYDALDVLHEEMMARLRALCGCSR